MDLHLVDATPSPAERAAIDRVLGEATADGPAPSGPPDPARRSLLLPALHAAQDCSGWISPGAVNYICERLDAPPAEVYGVASFYALFALEQRPPRVAHVCDDIACMTAGALDLCSELERTCGPAGAVTGDGHSAWLRSPCLGLCEHAPAVLYTTAGESPTEELVGTATASDVSAFLDGASARPRSAEQLPQFGATELRLLARIGRVDPTSIEDYRAAGGYTALRRALTLGPDRTIREVADSKLVGRGGAAFPTGRKWEAVARALVHPRYLVCNADESEPGTFKDRIIMEEDPFALIEAMTIAGYATGCERAFLYVRAEYPLAAKRLINAIEQARTRNLLGDDVMGRGYRFDIEVRRGAGAYICGEETALFNSIEGFRGEPRNKPPFPTDVGLFGRPTVVNNVETLVNVLGILREGGPAYAGSGTPDAAGTKLFCVCGQVSRPWPL